MHVLCIVGRKIIGCHRTLLLAVVSPRELQMSEVFLLSHCDFSVVDIF